jgi:hypothetical protein
MSAKSPQAAEQVVPVDENTNEQRTDGAAGFSLRSIPATVDAARQMAEMERVFSADGNHTRQMEVLATLRRRQLDPRLDNASRERANALVWRFQPNGWDEV